MREKFASSDTVITLLEKSPEESDVSLEEMAYKKGKHLLSELQGKFYEKYVLGPGGLENNRPKIVVNPEDSGDLEREKLQDIQRVEALKETLAEKFGEKEKEEELKNYLYSKISEALFIGLMNEWFKGNIEAYPASEYDDLENGVDVILKINGENPVVVAVDFTNSNNANWIARKFNNIAEEIEKGKMANIKYGKFAAFSGEVCRIIIGLEQKNMLELMGLKIHADDNIGLDKKNLASHWSKMAFVIMGIKIPDFWSNYVEEEIKKGNKISEGVLRHIETQYQGAAENILALYRNKIYPQLKLDYEKTPEYKKTKAPFPSEKALIEMWTEKISHTDTVFRSLLAIHSN
ncbi:MAG: hypothetical protein CEN90_228 [Parcubacteria group bacterium Licking1014_17]|nr:MAG: hypothetical protein CEN90_228 [Parcubacteria group bacterium Licking1014_17]